MKGSILCTQDRFSHAGSQLSLHFYHFMKFLLHVFHTNSYKTTFQMVRQSTITIVNKPNYHESENYHNTRSALKFIPTFGLISS